MPILSGIYSALYYKGMLSKVQLDELSSKPPSDPFYTLAKMGLLIEKIIKQIEDTTHTIYIPPENISVNKEALKFVPERTCRLHLFIPETIDNKTISIVMSDPTNIDAVDAVRFVTGRKVKSRWSNPAKVISMIDELYNPKVSISTIIKRVLSSELSENIDYTTSEITDEIPESIEKPIVQIVSTIFADAITKGASDIHIEPLENTSKVRYRIDGDLHEILTLPKTVHPAIVSRIKILCKLDISITRTPQDGKLRVRMKEKVLDNRVSTLPTAYGEKIVIRILDPTIIHLPLRDLGFSDRIEQKFKWALSQSEGMVIVTGPTGSGKSTTIYAALNWLKSTKINIVTIEDPIEYQIKGLNQVQVNPKAGLDFATTLKSILRQDPDIVFVGEMRDVETVKTAISAAQTGHLVLSTLHTNDAASVIVRLMDMGVPLYLISSALTAVLAQRLIKKLCPYCKKEVYAHSLNK